MKFLNIGCGRDIRRDQKVDWVNFDRTLPADILGDLEEPLPFKNNSFDLIFAHSIMEHIRNYSQLQLEICRVLKPNGQIQIFVPDYSSPDAHGDPDHVRTFSFHSFYSCYWYGMLLKSIRSYILKDPVNIKSEFPSLYIAPHRWLHATLIKLNDEELKQAIKANTWDQKMGCWQPKGEY